jgi:hypothetical protein
MVYEERVSSWVLDLDVISQSNIHATDVMCSTSPHLPSYNREHMIRFYKNFGSESICYKVLRIADSVAQQEEYYPAKTNDYVRAPLLDDIPRVQDAFSAR